MSESNGATSMDHALPAIPAVVLDPDAADRNGGAPACFPSAAALRAAHGDLLQRRRRDGNTPGLLEGAHRFIRRGQATGALLDLDDDRWACQSLLDYWANMLYRAEREPPDAALAEFDPTLAPDLDDALCPYVGLDAFREDDHARFFGRNRLVEDWVERLRGDRLLAVVGPSGSGKSSLVLGGLIPMLKAGALPGSGDWRYYRRIVPGSSPLSDLAWAIRPTGVNPGSWVPRQIEGFRQDPAHLARLVGEVGDVSAVLVVDQFEEVFTLCEDEGVRGAFVDNLLGLARAPGARHTVILTMRSDFESQVARLPELQEAFGGAEVRMPPLNAAELREAIERPAALVGLKFEEGVVDELIKEMLGEPAALPLLQFTLLKLWQNRERNRVTWQAYRRLGGARQALASSADAFYEGLIPEDQATARRILLRLVRPGLGLEVTSNRVRREALYRTGEAPDRVDRVLDKLVRARLVRLAEGDTPADARVEVAHEAIVRNWPRLVAWLDNQRVTMRQRIRLTAAAEQWQAVGRDPGGLLRGPLLTAALRYADLNELEAEFVEASKMAVEDAEREREAACQHEVEQARALAEAQRRRAEEQTRAARRLGRLAAALAAVLLLAVGAASVAFGQRRTAEARQLQANTARGIAEQQARIATSRRLAAQATSLLEEQLDLALLLGVKAYETANTLEAGSSLFGALEYSPRLRAFLHGHADQVWSLAFSPDGKTLASGNRDRTLVLWDVATRRPLGPPLDGHADSVTSLAFSPDGRMLASGAADGALILRDGATGYPVGSPFAGHQGSISSLAFDPDGQVLAAGGRDGTVIVWDVATRQRLGQPVADHESPVLSLAFSPDGRVLASGSADGILILRDGGTGQPLAPPLVSQIRRVASLAFSPDGSMLASGGADGALILRDGKTGKPLDPSLAGHRVSINSLAFSPDGRTLASGDVDGGLILWDVAGRRQLGPPLAGHTTVVASLAFSPDGATLASSSRDNTLILWDAAPSRSLGPSPADGAPPLVSAAFSPSGEIAALGSGDGAVTLWDVAAGQAIAQPVVGHATAVTSLAFSPVGGALASGGGDGTLILRDGASGALLDRSFAGHTAAVVSLAFSPDGRTLASSSIDSVVILWDVASGQALGPPLTGHAAQVTSLAFSPDGTKLAAGGVDGTAIVWDAASGQRSAQSLAGHKLAINSVAFSPDGRVLASGSRDNTVILWDVTTGRRRGEPLTGHLAAVVSLAFSSDGKRLASAGADGAVILRDGATGRRIGPILAGHLAAVSALAFSSDGKLLASGSSADNALVVRDVSFDLPTWRARACGIAARNLTPSEWHQYVGEMSGPELCPGLSSAKSLSPDASDVDVGDFDLADERGR